MNAVELRDICVAAAEAGARVLRDLYDRPRDVRFKGRTDLVTDADRALKSGATGDVVMPALVTAIAA